MCRIRSLSIILALFTVSPGFADCGAIAFNPRTQNWGRANGEPDLGTAMNSAIRICNDGCGIYAWTCGTNVVALVYRGNLWATGTGATVNEALAKAHSYCRVCSDYVTTSGTRN